MTRRPSSRSASRQSHPIFASSQSSPDSASDLPILLPNGEYKLIDFSNAAFTLDGIPGSVFAQQSNFLLIPPSAGTGSLEIYDNVLTYVAIPEPGMLSLLGLGAAALFRRSRR